VTRIRVISACLVALSAALSGCSLGNNNGGGSGVPPQVGAKSSDAKAAAKLGFPQTATKDTIRVGGGDAISDVAGVAGAVYPGSSKQSRPPAVILVDKNDWQGAIAASVLGATPIKSPILLTDGGTLPPVSSDTLKRLNPKGADLAKDAQVILIGKKPKPPSGRKTAVIKGGDGYEEAAGIDRFSTTARRQPSSAVVIASGERPEYAMPAAAWASRSGDSVLFTSHDSIPTATKKALAEHQKARIFVLGPEAVISKKVERQLSKLGRVTRISGVTPVQNAIEFARFKKGDFGWGVTVPGHNFSLASTTRPADAAAGATLAGNGVFAPLLLTDEADRLPRSLESYFLDVQPGFEQDPGQGVFNRVWILGDYKVISIPVQARIDEVTELIPVQNNRP
jgi:putative cell wall binding repeat protein